jgi:hypothetical protein
MLVASLKNGNSLLGAIASEASKGRLSEQSRLLVIVFEANISYNNAMYA